MSWLFSQALVEESLAGSFLTAKPSAQLNVMPTQHKFWRNGKMMEHSNLSRFGLTLNLLTEPYGRAVLTSYLEDFPVKTYLQPEQTTTSMVSSEGLLEKSQGCGKNIKELLEKFYLSLSLLKTPQTSEVKDLTSSSKTLTPWGIMLHGVCLGLGTIKHRIKESACGLWLPTPTAHNSKEGGYPAEGTRTSPTLGWVLGGKPNPQYVEWMMGWPIGWTDLSPLEMDKYHQWRVEQP